MSNEGREREGRPVSFLEANKLIDLMASVAKSPGYNAMIGTLGSFNAMAEKANLPYVMASLHLPDIGKTEGFRAMLAVSDALANVAESYEELADVVAKFSSLNQMLPKL